MKAFVWSGVLLVGTLVSGCITTESWETRVTIHASGSGSYLTVMRNLQSDETSEDAQASDFEDLMKMWLEDDYLLDGVSDGRYIKRRDLVIEDGVLVGREEGIFRSLDGAMDFTLGPGGVIRAQMADSLIHTNGTFVPDSGWIEWPPDARSLELRVRTREFDPHSDFVAMFRKRKGK